MERKGKAPVMNEEIREHLTKDIIPFWEGLRDEEFGGFYGLLTYDLKLDKKAVKGVILNSRILWFFSNCYMLLGEPKLLDDAKHAYDYMMKNCYDKEYGGVYWSTKYTGEPEDTTKHTYNMAFAIYALSSYYDASGDAKALEAAWALFDAIEKHCTDNIGYLEAFHRDFTPESNDKLSENGVMAEKTMNTLLHVFEGYTELYRVCKKHNTEGKEKVADRLRFMLDIFINKVYNPKLRRQEVFFDSNYNTIIDLYSYGHDIETSWLMERGTDILADAEYSEKIRPIMAALADNIYKVAYHKHSLWNECCRGEQNKTRIWWVQAESVLGFLNAYERDNTKTEYLYAAKDIWQYIKEFIIDKRPGSEWLSEVDDNGEPTLRHLPVVEPWKCPYHNGRMCMEILKGNVEICK